MYLIYQFAKVLVWFVFRLYFPKTTVLNLERLKFDHPAILVSNHPNTLLDVLHVAYRSKKQVFFLANASMFATKFSNWFFTRFYCIPIRRKKDSNSNINNAESFARCDDFLSKGGCLFIAPEGVSFMQRGLRPVKKGAARIALSAEHQNNFNLGLKIIPIGLTYDAPNYFGSRLIFHVGEPIDIRSFQNLYQENPSKATLKVTKLMEQRLKSNMVNPENETEDALLHQIEEIIRNERPLNGLADYERSKVLLKKLQQQKAQNAATYKSWFQKINSYFNILKELKVNDKAVFDTLQQVSLAKNIGLLILGFPFFIYGLLHNLLPVILTLGITRKANAYVGYNSTIKILAGLFLVFPLAYSLQSYFFYQFSSSFLWTIIYFLSLIPIGLFAWKYFILAKQTLRTWRFKVFTKRNAVKAQNIFEQRMDSQLVTKS